MTYLLLDHIFLYMYNKIKCRNTLIIFLTIVSSYRYIELKLESLVKLITDKVLLVEFLMQRTNTKYILIHILQNFMMQLPISLMDMPIIFDKLNSVYRNYLESKIQNQVRI